MKHDPKQTKYTKQYGSRAKIKNKCQPKIKYEATADFSVNAQLQFRTPERSTANPTFEIKKYKEYSQSKMLRGESFSLGRNKGRPLTFRFTQ